MVSFSLARTEVSPADKAGSNVLGMQFPLMGHAESPPQHLVPLHTTNGNDSNLLTLTAEGSNLSLGSNATTNSPMQLRHYTSQSSAKLNLQHFQVDAAQPEIEVLMCAHNKSDFCPFLFSPA